MEHDHVQVFVVRVPTFGDPDVERERLTLALARTLHHGVKPGVAVAPALTSATRHWFTRCGDWQTLDPLGDDMGHHGDEHPVPLVVAPDV